MYCTSLVPVSSKMSIFGSLCWGYLCEFKYWLIFRDNFNSMQHSYQLCFSFTGGEHSLKSRLQLWLITVNLTSALLHSIALSFFFFSEWFLTILILFCYTMPLSQRYCSKKNKRELKTTTRYKHTGSWFFSQHTYILELTATTKQFSQLCLLRGENWESKHLPIYFYEDDYPECD